MQRNYNRQKESLIELKDKLAKNGKCAFIRPTGFGKSHAMTQLCKDYKNTLYLYPAEVVKNSVERYYTAISEETGKQVELVDSSIENITFMTYMKLIRLSDKDIESMDYDLIVFDEMHKLGGTQTKQAVYKLFDKLPNAHFVGATATPNRMDAFDVVTAFFDNITTSPYTLHDAFEEGLLQRPYYVYCVYDALADVKDKVAKEIVKQNGQKAVRTDVLEKSVIEVANLYNIETVVSKVCHEYVKTDYMKFICFFDSIAHVDGKSKEVEKWFKTAYPDYAIRTLIVSSENKKYTDNVKKLSNGEREYTPKTIDLVFCIDMLNMGYHVNDITGIVMYRCTRSDIVYTQQLGRALSSGTTQKAIVFDIVNNINRQSMYDVFVREDFVSSRERHRQEAIANGTWEDTYMCTNPKTGEEIELPKSLYIDEDGITRKKWWHSANDFNPEDLVSTGIEATQRQLIKKAVADSMLMSFQKAFSNALKVYCQTNGIPWPLSFKELRECYNFDKKQFNDYFYNLVKSGRLNFPLHDARVILGKDEVFDKISREIGMTANDVLTALGY